MNKMKPEPWMHYYMYDPCPMDPCLIHVTFVTCVWEVRSHPKNILNNFPCGWYFSPSLVCSDAIGLVQRISSMGHAKGDLLYLVGRSHHSSSLRRYFSPALRISFVKFHSDGPRKTQTGIYSCSLLCFC
jgi:hypothetical protein